MTTDILFWVLAVVSAGAVAAMIVSKNPGHNALFLVLSFSALGGIFGLLGAPFAAAIQILVYAGAIMVLFIFVVMMIDPRFGIPPERRKRRVSRPSPRSPRHWGAKVWTSRSAGSP